MVEKKENELTRTFICIEFQDEVIKEIARVQEVLENKKFHGKITELENLHLTLKFLGEINNATLEKVKEKLKKIELNAFEAHLGEIGTFSFRGNPRIVWCKVCGKEVWDLQSAVDGCLAEIFQKEQRFMSHLTIARIKYPKDKKRFAEYVRRIKCKKIKFKVEKFFLKKSELKPNGPIYTTIEEYNLK